MLLLLPPLMVLLGLVMLSVLLVVRVLSAGVGSRDAAMLAVVLVATTARGRRSEKGRRRGRLCGGRKLV